MSEELNLSAATAGGQGSDSQELVTCVLDKIEFGLDINSVQEIVRLPQITPVPKAPSYVEGVANLRGNVLPIINLRSRFGMKASDNPANNRVVVVELNGKPTGMIVDAVREVMHVSPKDVEDAPVVVQGVDGKFLSGIVKLDSGRRLVMLLDQNALLDMSAIGEAAVQAAGRTAGSADNHAAKQAAEEDNEQLITFRVADEEYGIPIMVVQEIIRVPEITSVPNAPAGVIGITSLRSRIVPVMDLRTKFGLGLLQAEATGQARRDDERCLVVRIGAKSVALRVDAVNQVLQAPKSSVEPTPSIVAGEGAGKEQIRGIAKLDGGKRLIMLLAVQKLVSHSEFSAIDKLADGKTEGGEAAATETEDDERQLVSFKVADEEFAIDIMQVQEIVRLAKVTKVPHAPSFVEGVVNLRGNVLPVIDMRKRVHIASKDYNDATRVVVVDLAGKKTGIIVDAVSEVMAVDRRLIEPTPEIARSTYGDNFIEGVGKLNKGERMFLLLRAEELLRDEQVAAVIVPVATAATVAKVAPAPALAAMFNCGMGSAMAGASCV
ncbi:MAG: chemotaxis protein CheW [Planctomycetota bacterium]